MPFDNEIMFRSGTTNLTADEAGTYVAYPKGHQPMALRMVVPTLHESGDTIVVTVSLSIDGTNAEAVITFKTLTYAMIVTNHITEFFIPIPMGYEYIKVALDITDASGSDFDAGDVHIGLVPASRYSLA